MAAARGREAAGTGSLALTGGGGGAARGVWHPLRWHQCGQRERQWLSELQGTLGAGCPSCGHALFPPGGPSKEGGCVCFSWVWSKKPKEEVGIWFLPLRPPKIPFEPPLRPSPQLPPGAVMQGWPGAGPGAGAGGGVGTAAALGKRGAGGTRGLPCTQVVRSSGQPGGGSQRPGCLSWGHQGSGGGERQCRPRGRCGPWRLPGTSACRSQSAGTREAGRERERGRQEGNRGRRRDQNVSVRCLENKSRCVTIEATLGQHRGVSAPPVAGPPAARRPSPATYLSPGSGSPRPGPPFGHHPLPGRCGH